MRSSQYDEGRKAFFLGYSESDVAKFYGEGSPQAKDWMSGLMDARASIGSALPPREPFPTAFTMTIDPNWYRDEWGTLYLIRSGGDHTHPKDRLAIISKLARVRIRPYEYRYEGQDPTACLHKVDGLNWAECPNNQTTPISKIWCITMLRLLGYSI